MRENNEYTRLKELVSMYCEKNNTHIDIRSKVIIFNLDSETIDIIDKNQSLKGGDAVIFSNEKINRIINEQHQEICR